MTNDPTLDPQRRSWVEIPEGSDFPIQNLPFGIFQRPGETPRMGVAIGDEVLDVAALAGAGLLDELNLPLGVYFADSLNPLLEFDRTIWRELRSRLAELLDVKDRELGTVHGLKNRALVAGRDVELLIPVKPGDYVDFYSSLHHATNLGRMFRPDGDPLLPNWRHIPIGYHGRSSSLVVSGTAVTRPFGQRKGPDAPPTMGPSERLDLELEVGFVTGSANAMGIPVDVNRAEDHIFGLLLVNDWSARDIQAWEYQPLGPFLGKSFATSLSPWVVTLDALAPYRVPAPEQDPPVLDYLHEDNRLGLDLRLEIALATKAMPRPDVVSRMNFADMYWTMAQQLTHVASNGTPVQAGDLYASGTVSGPEPEAAGSLIELTKNGANPIKLTNGETRAFLEDGDTVVLRGSCGGGQLPRVGFGEVRGTVLPSGQ
ncbi:MAG: fumarylacetoacetase [Acidimicrobiia bacterium]